MLLSSSEQVNKTYTFPVPLWWNGMYFLTFGSSEQLNHRNIFHVRDYLIPVFENNCCYVLFGTYYCFFFLVSFVQNQKLLYRLLCFASNLRLRLALIIMKISKLKCLNFEIRYYLKISWIISCYLSFTIFLLLKPGKAFKLN